MLKSHFKHVQIAHSEPDISEDTSV